MDYVSKPKLDLPYLCDYGKDVDTWLEDFGTIMEMYDIQEPSRIFMWLKFAIEAEIKNVLKSLITTKNNVTRNPNYKEVQRAIEEYLEIKLADKCTILRELQIRPNKTIKNFNYRLTLKIEETHNKQRKVNFNININIIEEKNNGFNNNDRNE